MNQGDYQSASASFPVKRKRGRPRKYPVLDTVENTPPQVAPNLSSVKIVNQQGNQNVNHGGSSSILPGFKTPNGNQLSQGYCNQGANDVKVGQMVSGVVEAVFDAGCLLTVRVGDSQTTLRGVVFRHGTYVPVSAQNDVAPNVQMIKRQEIPLPTVNYSQVQGHSPQAKEITLQLDGTSHPPSKLPSDSIPNITNPDASTSVSRNEQSPSATQAASISTAGVHPTSSGYQVASSSHPSNASASTTIQPTAHPAGCMLVDKSGAQNSSDDHENVASAPLQADESTHNHSAILRFPSPHDNRTDKMSELLRAVQENFDDDKEPEAQ